MNGHLGGLRIAVFSLAVIAGGLAPIAVQAASSKPQYLYQGQYTSAAAYTEIPRLCTSKTATFPSQWTWDPQKTAAQPQPATSGTPKIEQYRNGQLIATYSALGDVYYGSEKTQPCSRKDNSAFNPAASAACGAFPRGFRNWLDGDLFLVYPAVYSGGVNQPYLGPAIDNYQEFLDLQKAQKTDPHALPPHIPHNITIRGVTVNGARPVIKMTDGAHYNNMYQSAVYFDLGYNITLENIDIDATGSTGWIGQGGIYILGTVDLTIHNVRVHGFQNSNGIFATPLTAGTLTLDGLDVFDNGGWISGRNAHNFYLNGGGTDPFYPHYVYDPKFTVHMLNSWSHAASVGHTFKSRAPINILEGNYFQGSLPHGPNNMGESYLVDIPDGGQVVLRNNVLAKNQSGNGSNGIMFAFDMEASVPGRVNSLDIENNTFVGFAATYDGTHPISPMGFFYPQKVPGTTGFPLTTYSIAQNAFVGFCPQNQYYPYTNYRGDLAAIEAFSELDQDFSLGTQVAAPAPSTGGIAGTPAYKHAAQDGLTRTTVRHANTNFTLVGAEDQ